MFPGCMSCSLYTLSTSSTAQGGGGSFKNRKPIGKVGCCESGMAEPSHWWIERWLMVPLFFSLSLTIYLPTYLCIYLSIDRSIDRSIYLSIYLSIYPSIYLSIYLSLCVCLSICLSVHLSIYLSFFLSFYPSIHLSIYPSIYLSISLSLSSVCLSIYLSTCLSASFKTKLFCETYFFIFHSWQHQKRSNSARLPEFLNLTTSKTKQFCETSSFFELDNIQNEAILRDFFNFWTWQHQKQNNSARLPSNIKSWVQRWQTRTNAFCHLSTPPV